MEARNRKPGSVRLSELQYQEMHKLGFTNESAYVRYKMEQAESKLNTLQETVQQVKMLPATREKVSHDAVMEDQLTIQRLSMENRKLQEKLEQISKSNQETLNGVGHKVHSLLQEELQKRDYEDLKKSYSQSESKVKKLQEDLDESKKEIKALVKKLGLVELGKALLPGAISGLAKHYPKQMKGIAGTLGRLGVPDTEGTTNEEQQHLLQILEYLQEVCTQTQFEQVLQLMMQVAEQLKDDEGLIQKIGYYMEQLQQKKKQNNTGSKEA